MNGSSRGAFICIEGVDAVGKKTQSSILNSRLVSRGFSTAMFSFPDYGTAMGREIRRFLAGEKTYPPEVRSLLYSANRWEKREELEAALSRNDVLIANRYTASNIAYGTSNGLDLQWLLNLDEGLPKPDLVLVLDAPVEVLKTRRARGKDAYERDLLLQDAARRSYLTLSGQFGWRIIDAAKGIDSTSGEVISTVSAFLDRNRARTV